MMIDMEVISTDFCEVLRTALDFRGTHYLKETLMQGSEHVMRLIFEQRI